MSEANTAESVSLNDMFDDFDDIENNDVVENVEPDGQNVEQAEATPEVEQAPELIDPPEYFPKEFREHFDALQKLEGGKDYAQQWANQYSEHQKFITSKLDEVAQSKHDLQTFQQYQQALQPLNNIWQSQGMHPAMGVAQMAHYGQLLHSDPQALIKEIAESRQIDLNKLIEEQPYVDPHIAEQLQTLKQQNQQFQQTIGQFQQGQTEQQNQALISHIMDFKNEQDNNGQPLRPYFDQVRPAMEQLLNVYGNEYNDLQSAYDRAVMLDPSISGEIQKNQEKAKAEQLHKEAQKASSTNTSIASNTADTPTVKRTINNMFDDMLDD